MNDYWYSFAHFIFIVSKSEWWHIMLIIVPNDVEVTDTAILWVTGTILPFNLILVLIFQYI